MALPPLRPINPDPLFTSDEAEDYCSLGRRCLEAARARQNPRYPQFVRLGSAVRYRKSDLDAWIEANRVDYSTRVGGRTVLSPRRGPGGE